MNLINVVGVRQINETKYLLIPRSLAKKLDIKNGDRFTCYQDETGIRYQKIQPMEAEQDQVVEVEA